MAKRKPDEPKKGAPEWQCTFSDLMNLLLCFFVLLFSMSTPDTDRWEQVVASMSSAFSIFTSGSAAIGDGSLIGLGTTQLSELDEYYDTVGQTSEDTGEDERNRSSNNEADSSNGKTDDTQTGGKADDTQTGGKDQQNNTGGKTSDDIDSGKTPEEDIGGKDKQDETGGKDKQDNTGGKTQDDIDSGKTPEEDVGGKDKQDEIGGKSQQDETGGKDQQDNTGGKTPDEIDSGKKREEDIGGKTPEDETGGKTLIEELAVLERAESEEMLDNIAELTERYNISDSIALSLDSQGKYVELTLSGSLLFDSGSAELKSSCLPLLSKVGDILKVYSKHSINIIGHTDNVPMKSSKYDSNDILSSARAISAAQYLVNEKHISVERLSWTGRGEYEPVASNATAEGRARNRRIEIRIYNSFNSN